MSLQVLLPSQMDHVGRIQARDYKTFFMLNSAEHEILNAHKYKNI